LAAGLAGCQSVDSPAAEVREGSTRDEVRTALGEPAEVNEFVLPSEPFFGPQEGLSGIVPAGSGVEEWVYRQDGEVLYVWFSGQPGEDQAGWTVIMTATYPKDAVF
jgi:hypothetical protein